MAQWPVSRIRPSPTFVSSALSPFSDYRFDIHHLEFCQLLVVSRRDSLEIFMIIFGSGQQKKSGIWSQFCRIGIWRFEFSIVVLWVFRQIFVAGTNSAQWSFRHKIVDKQYYSASWGILQFFFFSAVIAVRLCRDICGKRRNFLLKQTKIVLWQ